jgi:hypothetical protein
MALSGFMAGYAALKAWDDIQILAQAVETYGHVLRVTPHQVPHGRRFQRRYSESYTTTLQLAPECGVESGAVELDERPDGASRVHLYCVPGTGIVAVDRGIDSTTAFVFLFFGGTFGYGAWLFAVTLLRGWRSLLEKGPRRSVYR